MGKGKYYVGFDIGTDSVGYAVVNEGYNLCKFKGEPMWGVTIFDEAKGTADRRNIRAARRRLDRRQHRVQLIMDLFAKEIGKKDPSFFKRIKESYLYPETGDAKIRLFDTYESQKEYTEKYPTIHHLIVELMNSTECHDARLVYLACAWLVAHRGHFLSNVGQKTIGEETIDKETIGAVTDFRRVYNNLVEFIERDDKYKLAWKSDADLDAVANVLKKKGSITQKTKELTKVLFGKDKAPKCVDAEYEYNYELVIKLLCGGKVGLKALFDKEEYGDLEENTIALNMDDEKLGSIMQSIGDNAELISVLKPVYDWSVLVDMLKGKQTISEAKVEAYEQHQRDLKVLKYFTKKYVPEKYGEIFRSMKTEKNYVAYIGKNKVSNEVVKVKKSLSKEDFCDYIRLIFEGKGKEIEEEEYSQYSQMISRLQAKDFMPKQVDKDNRVIPYQLYLFELEKILENAKVYLPFLNEKEPDDDITTAEKILSVFKFRVPYYVGPLKEKSNPKWNHWMVRKAEGKIYPWNFEDKVDLDASENAFIARMTNSCTYLPGRDVLPKNSMVYCKFEVLNEINNIKINDNNIPINVKQNIYENVFKRHKKVTLDKIKNYLISNNDMKADDVISGIDITIKSSLNSFIAFKKLIEEKKVLTESEAEEIIKRATYSEDKGRFSNWLQNWLKNEKKDSKLSKEDVEYISGLKIKGFGRLSYEFLCGTEGENKKTGESYHSILQAMWETNCNLMQLLSEPFTFMEKIAAKVKEYYDSNCKSVSERLDEMAISNAVKRPIVRTLDILKDVVKVQGGHAPERIFIEMARGAGEDQKGKRTKTRREQIIEKYAKVTDEEKIALEKELERLGEKADNKLQSDKLFLYFLQFGKCLYTGKSIDIESVISGDGTYNIEHIYPRSFVKDDSILNNLILVDSKANGDKGDNYPINPDIQNKMCEYWKYLHQLGLISDEKYKRLTRKKHFTPEEKFEFINRQLVETRQSTKAVASLLKELYPETEIVYIKAGLISEFRQKFGLLKSRSVNDLHHAKDAYLSIVVGNVWHCKFSAKYWSDQEQNNAKIETVFGRPVVLRDGKTVWNGGVDKERVVKTARKNTAHLTMYSYYKHSGQNGGFFDQNPLPAAKGLIPLKKNRNTEIYGGYDSATVAGFILVKYKEGKKTQVSLVPLKLLNMKKFIADDNYALQYITEELGGKAEKIEILLNKRIIKIYTMFSLNGARYCIRGKAGKSEIGLMNMMPFMTSPENEEYIKKLERFNEKYKNNNKLDYGEKYDGITIEKNMEMYNLYIKKLESWPYSERLGNKTLKEKLEEHSSDFSKCEIPDQVYVLLQIQGLFGRSKQADLRKLGESANSGITRLSLNLSNWKKNYDDVRIIDQSASGLFEKISDNLLELL